MWGVMNNEPRRGRGRPRSKFPKGDPNAFATWLAASGYTVEQVADRLGVRVPAVYGWRRGNRPPSRKMAAHISAFTGGVVSAGSWDL